MFNPVIFAKLNYLSRRDNNEICEEFSDEIAKMSGRCLDVGSGPGDLAVDIVLPKLNSNSTLVCSDISEPMVNYGREKYKTDERMSFVKLDIETRNLPDDMVERFAHITSFYCVHWCQDMRQVFENLFNLLEPGGTTLLTFLIDFPTSDAYEPLAALPRYRAYMEDVRSHIPVFRHVERPRETLKALLRDVGFQVRHCSLREKSHTYDDPDAMGEFMASVDPFVERFPVELRTQYKKDLVDEVTRQNRVVRPRTDYGGGCGIFIQYHMFVVYLRKPTN